MVPFPVTLSDGLNYIWDFQNKGGINRGSNAVFDGAFLNLDLPNVTQAQESLGGRMFTLSGDSRYFQDIALSRSVYVPDNAGWVRFVDTATNTGDTAKFYNFRIYSDFGADVRTQIAASGDGNLTLGLNDDWALINGTDAPSVGVVWGNDSADALTPTEAWLANDDLAVSWTVTLQPGETLSILHFALQDHDETRLQSNIDALSGELTAEMLAGLDFDTMDSIANFDLGELVAPQTLYFGNGSDDVLMGADHLHAVAGSGHIVSYAVSNARVIISLLDSTASGRACGWGCDLGV